MLDDNLIDDSSIELELTFDEDYSGDKFIDNSFDALIISLNDKGCIDLEYMNEISNIPIKNLIEDLKEYIFQDPESWDGCWYKGYQTKNEYLSGDIFRKIKKAEEANEICKGLFEKNIIALKELLPKGVSYKEIFYSIGSPWIDEEIVKDFIVSVFGSSLPRRLIIYVKETATWVIHSSISFHHSANYTFGTNRIGTKKMLLNIINHKEISVYDSVLVNGKEKRVLNKEETILAQEKAELLERAFKTYIVRNNLQSKIEQQYNEKYRYIINRKYDGHFLNLPKLYDYQKDAVARILFNKNTLLAHNVGAGKTYVIITASEELLRLGYSQKNIIIVPNSILGQWVDIYNSLYPESKLLVIYPEDFTIHTKEEVLKKIKNGDYKTVLTAFSVFDRFSHSKEVQKKFINEQIEELENSNIVGWVKTHHIETCVKELKKKLNKIDSLPDDDGLTFEELGFTRLFVDEAHNYKNIPIVSKMNNINGISLEGTEKCINMLLAVDYMNASGHGVIMATGTPVTNSVSDIYTFQRYLQKGQLKLLDIDSFDKWLTTFTEISEEVEVDVDSTSYRIKKRISKFHNIMELTTILALVCDFYNPNMTKELPDFNGYTDIVVENNDVFKEFIKDISERIELIRSNLIDRKEDNLLKVTIDGRKAALDLRLVYPDSLLYDYKVNKCAEEIYKIYQKYPDTAQAVFCDYSIPKEEFNVYDELKRILVSFGLKKMKFLLLIAQLQKLNLIKC